MNAVRARRSPSRVRPAESLPKKYITADLRPIEFLQNLQKAGARRRRSAPFPPEAVDVDSGGDILILKNLNLTFVFIILI